MQTFLPQIKILLNDWYFLTRENPLYALALVLSAWLITVFFYSIRIYFLNRKRRVVGQASIKLQSQLDETQQKNKLSEEKLAEVTEQIVKEQQLATDFSLKVEQRNQQIVENIKQLASKFNLSEQLVSSDEKPKSEFVWQQQDNIQMQLTERLQAESQEKKTLQENYKQERELFSKQKALIEQLQKNLDLQTSKSTQLEQDLNAQRLMQQQQINEADQKLADKLADVQSKHELDVASLENKLNQQRETLIIDTEVKKPADNDVQAEVYQASVSDETSQFQANTFEPEVSLQEKELAAETKPEPVINESVAEVVEPTVTVELVEQEVSAVPAFQVEQEEVEPDYTKSNLDITGKIKGLFAKGKKQAIKTAPKQQTEVLAAKVSIPEPGEVVAEPEYAKSNLDISGKFNKLFAKDKKQVVKTEPKQQAEVLAEKVSIPEPDEVVAEPEYAKSNLDITGKFKGLFAKDKKQAVKTEPKQQAEIVNTAARETESEEQVYEPDYTKSNMNISGKVKKLFGKS